MSQPGNEDRWSDDAVRHSAEWASLRVGPAPRWQRSASRVRTPTLASRVRVALPTSEAGIRT
jgi:hypothetical protein